MPMHETDDDAGDDESDDESDYRTMPCPHCKREIAEDAVQCPRCRNYLSDEDLQTRGRTIPKWAIVTAIVMLVVFVFSMVLRVF